MMIMLENMMKSQVNRKEQMRKDHLWNLQRWSRERVGKKEFNGKEIYVIVVRWRIQLMNVKTSLQLEEWAQMNQARANQEEPRETGEMWHQIGSESIRKKKFRVNKAFQDQRTSRGEKKASLIWSQSLIVEGSPRAVESWKLLIWYLWLLLRVMILQQSEEEITWTPNLIDVIIFVRAINRGRMIGRMKVQDPRPQTIMHTKWTPVKLISTRTQLISQLTRVLCSRRAREFLGLKQWNQKEGSHESKEWWFKMQVKKQSEMTRRQTLFHH